MEMKYIIKTLILVLLCFCFTDCKGQTNDSSVRPPAVAGKFYPLDSAKLRTALKYFFDDAVKQQYSEKPLGIIVPHAGYLYSGQIAADAFNQVRNYDYDVVVILGTNHTTADFSKISVYPKGAFRTPLGLATIDEDITGLLLKEDADCVTDISPQETEHSVEVQVPFIQYLFPNSKIVPLVIGSSDLQLCAKLGRTLAKILKDKKALIVASSDLSHYPDYDDAVSTDKNTLDAVVKMNTENIRDEMNKKLSSDIHSLVTCACGEGPILALVTAVKESGGNFASLLSYANSGNSLVGDNNRVVGYGAVAFYKSEQNILSPKGDNKNISTENNKGLSVDDKLALLKLARKSIEQYLTSETLPLPRNLTSALKTKQGAFVTLNKNGELRGCIGNMSEEFPLFNVVGRMALSAAFNDTRFQPLLLSELSEVEVEISVLTPFTRINSADDIVLGRDGVILKKDGKQAVYLPQVATETGWYK
jgi:AmmeMemoRadiSam system protein B/AmmeMemoRadiSam system protein A